MIAPFQISDLKFQMRLPRPIDNQPGWSSPEEAGVAGVADAAGAGAAGAAGVTGAAGVAGVAGAGLF